MNECREPGGTRIKICGLSRVEDIGYANEARPDYVGFVFAKSKRRVTPEKARELRKILDGRIVPVGVFVDAEIGEIAELIKERIIDMVQLHGSENGEYIVRLREKCGAKITVIKAVRLENGETPPDGAGLRGRYGADYVLLDSGTGSGKAFDWRVIDRLREGRAFRDHFFLAGGVNGGNIRRAAALHPFGIDVSSGAETNGVKDREKMLALTAECRRAGRD
jgi:phosphoribosylanthranilate isomerase